MNAMSLRPSVPWVCLALVLALAGLVRADDRPLRQVIDAEIHAAWEKQAIKPTATADDAAFLRRIRFVVRFPFPDEDERREIWRRIFPVDAPLAGLDEGALAALSLAGGNIRNVALSAAFLAADGREPIGMTHLARAAARECAKLERPLTEAALRGWL